MIREEQFKLKKDGTANSICYCRTPELIENYDKAIADDSQVWECHHRLETHNSDGEKRLVNLLAEELKALDMYFNRPPEELIFLTTSEHERLHKEGKKRGPRSEEWKRKLSEALKGRKHSEEHKRKLSAVNKRQRKGKHWKLVDGKRVWY